MKLLNSGQARELDRITSEKYNIPSLLLMENAGLRIADEVPDGRVLVICGKGNNGGDGSVAARHLFARGIDASLVYICNTDELCGDAKTAFTLAKNFGVPVLSMDSVNLKDYDIIIDGIFGIGLSGAPYGTYKDIISAVNGAKRYVISIDIPSGGDADNGAVFSECIKADKTVTFGAGRTGLFCYPLKEYAGEVTVKPISFVPFDGLSDTETLEKPDIPEISAMAHKGSNGKVLVVSGSRGMTGAATLNCKAALRSGCGIVTLCIPESLNDIMEIKLTEAMTLPMPDDDGALSEKAAELIIKETAKYDAVLCGSGLSQTDGTRTVVRALVKNCEKPLILDADALNIISEETDILKSAKSNIIITPHIGEMARLTGSTASVIAKSTVTAAREFAKSCNVVTVLKSAHTVIASPDGKAFINTMGNGGMATAGSGDVLAGITAAFAAQGFDVLTAAKYAVFSHASAGDKAAAKYGMRYINASDIVNNLKD